MSKLPIPPEGFEIAKERASRFHSVERVKAKLGEIFCNGFVPINLADEEIPIINASGLLWIRRLKSDGERLNEVAEQVVVQVRQWEAGFRN